MLIPENLRSFKQQIRNGGDGGKHYWTAGITVEFLCPDEIQQAFEHKFQNSEGNCGRGRTAGPTEIGVQQILANAVPRR